MGAAHADEFTVSQDTMRTGWDPNEPGLTPAQVSSSQFGLQFSTAVNGQVYAQPLVVGGTVVTATENAEVYGIDAATGAVHWSKSLGTPWPASAIGCGDLVPNFGVTSTPVYDPATNAVYVSDKVDSPDSAHPAYFLHALNPATGAERSGWPVRIQGAPGNDPTRPFDAFHENQRAGLLLLGGKIYIGYGSHCDINPYRGFVVSVDTGTRGVKLWTTENSASNGMSGVWGAGGGLVSDGPGRIFLSTGNGVTPPAHTGTNPPGQLSESVVRLGLNSDGSMHAQDFFSPANAPTLDQNDTDLGSGGPLALPATPFGASTAHPHLLVEVGKDGRVFLLDRDNLGGRKQGSGGGDAVLGITGPFQGVWGHPAAYGGGGGYVYEIGSNGPLRALAFGLNAQGNPELRSAGASAATFGYTSGSPVITSDGTKTGSATVWAEYAGGPTGANAELRAYDAIPSGGSMRLLFSAPIGHASKFAVPATSGGRVYVGTRDGRLMAFGFPAGAALQGPATDFGQVPVGSTKTLSLTVKASRPVKITAVTTTAGGPFTATPGTLPKSVAGGGTFTVPIAFSPTAAGPTSGQVTFTTDFGTFSFGLTGYGTHPGFTAFPPALDFGQVPTGSSQTLGVSFTNTGTSPETVTAVSAPGSPFSAPDLAAANGTTVQPQQSVSINVTYAPTVASSADTGSLSVTGPDGTATVSLTGSAVTGAPHLSITPTTTAFGSVAVGTSRTLTFDIANTGNIPLTVTKAAPPAAPFQVSNPISEGQVLAPGEVVHQGVTFSPTATGSFSGVYQITGNDGQGPQNETVTGTGTAPGSGITVPDPTAGGWQLNGTAQISGTDLDLTQAQNNQAGSAVFPVPVLTDGLKASFTSVIGGGSGADGLALAFLDPAKVTPKSLGQSGYGLGFAPLPGVAVALDTYRTATNPSNNFVGITTGLSTTAKGLTWAATSTAVPALRSGPHAVTVAVTGHTVVVTVDGKQALSTSVASLPPTAYLAFTGGTGGLNDIHTVRGATITARSYAVPPPGPNGWVTNGSATMSGTTLVLTPAKAGQTGSAFQSTAVPSGALSASFTATIGGGSGADGMTFAMLDSSKSTAKALGTGGAGLGWLGLPGVAVALDTHKNANNPSGNFVAVTVSASNGNLVWSSTSSAIPNLRGGPVAVTVTVSGGKVLVSVAGKQVISASVPVPPNVLVGFTAGTGSLTDSHAVSGVTIGY
ncbi:choice-of-anchor D domain-containing protein [Streptacidiphilus jiangxiensis]|uniref:choice-of-anchor D domain-containing protein n=1 Tax=Streptacidiphilus jiangxiensis TaxID=235985 RepID=UPI00069424A1|nr:choice-of-anchor D domain-containing protein [Streptacidiphilus jiangxiensis]